MDVSDEGNVLPAYGSDFAAQGLHLWIKTRPREFKFGSGSEFEKKPDGCARAIMIP
ncbi:hypothetical protein [Desulfosporosinus lacus]|uniref:hypothetical protein n=1 Tax=Desulfosporosinus lacus TaxID=329936 RepID=UPI001A9A58A0|nr:hypothetical protein [Desulfosporosinus lacus]